MPRCLQRLIQIPDNILRLLQSHAETDKSIAEFLRVEVNPLIIAI